jgi:hypothetical protein
MIETLEVRQPLDIAESPIRHMDAWEIILYVMSLSYTIESMQTHSASKVNCH